MNIDSIYQVKANPNVPTLNPGDMVKVSFKIKEAARERLQTFPGLVIKVRRGSSGGSFTIRKVASGIGVEHTFPFASPLLDKVEVVRHGKVRRAKLYYIRRLSTREARLKERRERLEEEMAASASAALESTEIEKAAPEDTVTETQKVAETQTEKIIASEEGTLPENAAVETQETPENQTTETTEKTEES